MQPAADPITRPVVTAAQVTTLLQDSPSITLRGGLELVDIGLNLIEDISDSLEGGEVTRDSYAVMHGSAGFNIARDLPWGSALLRPYIIVSGGTRASGPLSARFNLGVYHPTIPENSTLESPQSYDVDGFDILYRLNQPVGDAYAIAAGDNILARVEEIIVARGYTEYVIDPTRSDAVAPTNRSWVFDDQTTWLGVVNDLLGSIGYRGVWSDWDGRLRCHYYIHPAGAAVEWTYTDNAANTMLGLERRTIRDYTEAPNRWVVYRNSNVNDTTPVEGAGMVTIVNQSVGDTSIDARGGLEITKPVGVEANDQGALIVIANSIVEADMSIPQVITTALPVPNPRHWHYDRLLVSTADFFGDVQCTNWTMPLPPDSGPMGMTWRVISA